MALALERCIVPATPAEIGAWVDRWAGDRIRQRVEVLAPRVAATEGTLTKASPSRVALSRRRHRRLAITGAVLFAAAIAGGVALALKPARGRVEASRAGSVATTTPTATAIASTTASATETASAIAPPTPTAAPPAAPVKRHARVPRAGTCDPLYVIDARGNKVYKPDCL
jgi:hypothetical protein